MCLSSWLARTERDECFPCQLVEEHGSYLYGADDFEMQGVLCCMKLCLNSEQKVEDWRFFGHEGGSEVVKRRLGFDCSRRKIRLDND